MWLLIVTTDTGASEDGNVYYCDFHVYESEADACAAVCAAGKFDAEFVTDQVTHFSDEEGNLLIVQPVELGGSINLQMEQEEFYDEEEESDEPPVAVAKAVRVGDILMAQFQGAKP